MPGLEDALDPERFGSDLTVLLEMTEMWPRLMPALSRSLATGCGIGHALVLAAAEWPRSRFVGYELDEGALELGRRRAAERGLGNLRFERRDATRLGLKGALDADTSRPGALLADASSVGHCLQVSLAAGGKGVGNQWGRDAVLADLAGAGFAKVVPHDSPAGLTVYAATAPA